MPAPISVVIPTLNAATELPFALTSLVEGLEAGLIRELIVSDGGSVDETLAIADAAGAALVHGPAGRGGQLRRGVAAASGEWVLLLHADTGLPDAWTAHVQAHMAEADDMAAYFRLSFRAEGVMPRLVAGWANFRSRLFGLPYGDQGLLVRRAILQEVGGVPDLPLMEDVALARALRGRLRSLGAAVSTSAARYEADGWLRRGARNLTTLILYLGGRDPAALAERYVRGARRQSSRN